MTTRDDLEILYTRDDAREDAPRVNAYRTRVTKYGDMIDVECYPMWANAPKKEIREAKRGTSSKAQIKQDIEKRRRHVRYLVGCNFERGDAMVTLTYDYSDVELVMAGMGHGDGDSYVPECDEDAARDLTNYLRRLKRWAKKHAPDTELRWLSVTEVGAEKYTEALVQLPRKYHHHVLIHGIPADVAESLWQYGRTNSRILQPNRQGLNEIAGYICKQRLFYRQFRHSKNLRLPEVKVSDRKISARRVNRVAENVMRDGREIFEKIYPEYEIADRIDVKYSDYVAGAYIRATMHKRRAVIDNAPLGCKTGRVRD